MTASAMALPTLRMCKRCQCRIATSWDGYCHVHSPGRPLRSYSDRPSPSPRTIDPIGVELELVNPMGVNRLTPIERFVCSDGSLPQDTGGEIKIVGSASRIADKIADTVQRARIAGAEADTKCGFHVHLSHRKGWTRSRFSIGGINTETELISSAHLHAAQWGGIVQDYLFSIMPKSRKENRYCRKISNYNDILDHYCWLSWSSRVPTVEIRLHASTTNPMKAKAWLRVCVAMRDRINRVIDPKTRAEEIELATNAFNSCGNPAEYLSGGDQLAKAYLQARDIAQGSLQKFCF